MNQIFNRLIIFMMISAPATAMTQSGDAAGWDHYGGGQHGMQYSNLSQISRDNVADLKEIWRYRTGELGEGHREPFAFEANPILVEGKLYLPTGSAIVIALDPATGKEIWRHDPKIDRTKPHAEIANRGVTSWIDPEADSDSPCHHRIFVGTLDARLIALDGVTGKPCQGFGADGEVRLNRDVWEEEGDWVNYTVTSPPVVVDDVLVIGSAIGDNRNVRSELGVVYIPTGSASPDFYGGEREGANLYADSIVALKAATGEMVWYRQLIHHDVWDYDLSSQPTLVDLEHNGETIPAVLQGTKTGLIFSFNRETGEPIFEIEEREVPQGGVAGEHLSPTQPFPVAPPPLSRHTPVTEEDAWGMMFFDTRSCRKKIAGLHSEGIFTPPSLEGTIQLPGYAGGINWGGLAFEPNEQTVIVFSMGLPMEVALIPRDDLGRVHDSGEFEDFDFSRQTGTPYGMRRAMLGSPLDIPCTAPPWGTLSAIDMRKGTIIWQRAVGSIEDVAPAIVPNFELGMPGMGGPIITGGGVIFMAATMDDYLRAFDLKDGKILWEGRLPAGGQATPMTYFLEKTGKQYVVIAAGGHGRLGTTGGDYIIAYALDD